MVGMACGTACGCLASSQPGGPSLRTQSAVPAWAGSQMLSQLPAWRSASPRPSHPHWQGSGPLAAMGSPSACDAMHIALSLPACMHASAACDPCCQPATLRLRPRLLPPLQFKAEAPPPPPAKPAVPEVAPSIQQLARLAEAARNAGRAVFTLPESSQPGQGVPVGTTCTIYYDRSKGPLPGNANVALKVRGWVTGASTHMVSSGVQDAADVSTVHGVAASLLTLAQLLHCPCSLFAAAPLPLLTSHTCPLPLLTSRGCPSAPRLMHPPLPLHCTGRLQQVGIDRGAAHAAV